MMASTRVPNPGAATGVYFDSPVMVVVNEAKDDYAPVISCNDDMHPSTHLYPHHRISLYLSEMSLMDIQSLLDNDLCEHSNTWSGSIKLNVIPVLGVEVIDANDLQKTAQLLDVCDYLGGATSSHKFERLYFPRDKIPPPPEDILTKDVDLKNSFQELKKYHYCVS